MLRKRRSQKEIQRGSPNPAARGAAVREIQLRVIRDQFEKTLTALTDAEQELATSPVMANFSDEHPTKKAVLTKILYLKERSAVLKKELQEINARSQPAAAVAANGLPQSLPPGKPSAVALKWHFAWVALTEKRKLLEVGRIAPDEVLAAERDLAIAEGEFRGKPETGAVANVTYARAMLDIARRKQAVGRATQREVNDATLALTQGEEALKELQATRPTPSR